MAAGKGLIILGAFAVTLVWTAAVSQPDRHSHIWAVAGKSDFSLIVRSGQGRFALINPAKTPKFLTSLGEKLPFYERAIDLVVFPKGGQSDDSILTELERRYRVRMVLTAEPLGSPSKDNKVDQVSGESALSWDGLSLRLFFIAGQDGVVKIEGPGGNLLLLGRGTEAWWRVLPKWGAVTNLAVSSGVLNSSASTLLDLFHPQLILTETRPRQLPSSSPAEVVREREIVW